MRTHSPLIVDVRELLEAPGSHRSLSLRALVADLQTGSAAVRNDLTFDLSLEAIDGGILVRGRISGRFVESCRRCLKEVATPFQVQVAEIYRPPGGVWEEGYVIQHDTIDLERAARDTVGLEIPMSPLCRPDCAGLCPRCGADLNEGRCACPPEEGDARWSALRELRLPGQ
jgi:uncharacterized protein